MIKILALLLASNVAVAGVVQPQYVDGKGCDEAWKNVEVTTQPEVVEVATEVPNAEATGEITPAQIRGFKTIMNNMLSNECPIGTIGGIIENQEDLKRRWDYINKQLDEYEKLKGDM